MRKEERFDLERGMELLKSLMKSEGKRKKVRIHNFGSEEILKQELLKKDLSSLKGNYDLTKKIIKRSRLVFFLICKTYREIRLLLANIRWSNIRKRR